MLQGVCGRRGFSSVRSGTGQQRSVTAASFGWTLRHDDPYRGGFSTAHYGRPAEGVHAIQIEIARRLYMDEQTLAKSPNGFAQTQRFCNELVGRLGRLTLRAPR